MDNPMRTLSLHTLQAIRVRLTCKKFNQGKIETNNLGNHPIQNVLKLHRLVMLGFINVILISNKDDAPLL